jgi:hypothetical protein
VPVRAGILGLTCCLTQKGDAAARGASNHSPDEKSDSGDNNRPRDGNRDRGRVEANRGDRQLGSGSGRRRSKLAGSTVFPRVNDESYACSADPDHAARAASARDSDSVG